MQKLVLASRNKGKLKELKNLLEGEPFEICSLEDFPEIPEIPETGNTFNENAFIKAKTVADYTGYIALADDSGLEVDALNGAPGVYSARFAGEEQDDAANKQKLLQLLKNIPLEKRNARFRCAVAVVEPGGFFQATEGVCEGKIAFEPRGKNGFGYDPIFIVEGCGGKTMAELNLETKNTISHRARAFKKAAGILKRFSV
jgi:XTP/dITP diphosphohydrolase